MARSNHRPDVSHCGRDAIRHAANTLPVIRKMVEMMLTGRTLDAAAGERLGLSHYLVEPGKALEKAIELANAIAKNALIPNYLIVQAIPRIEDMSAADGLWTESVAQAVSMTSEDARAGIDAFFGKRKIEF